jgi:hypothetical protein
MDGVMEWQVLFALILSMRCLAVGVGAGGGVGFGVGGGVGTGVGWTHPSVHSVRLLKLPFGFSAHVYSVSSHLYIGAGEGGGVGQQMVSPTFPGQQLCLPPNWSW